MDNFNWQHIEFENGGNPYICKTEKEFNRMKAKYNLVHIQNNFWLAKSEQTEDMFYADLLMEQQEQM
jgi:hypothetical protein